MEQLERLQAEIQKHMETIPNVILNPSFDLIFELFDNQEAYVDIPKYNIKQLPAIFNKNANGGFTIEVEGIISDMSEAYEAEIQINGKIYVVSNLFISMNATTLKRNEHDEYFSGKITFTGQIHELHLKNAPNIESYNRFIISTHNTQMYYYVDTSGYRDESTMNAYGRLAIVVGDKHLILYEKKIRDKHYFIIDSEDLIDSEVFSNICHSIMIGFGFISANFIQDEAFYFKSDVADFSKLTDFSYLQLRPSIISNGFYNPIYSNPYGYTKDDTIVKEIGNRLVVFNSDIFSTFCNKIHENQDYATLILLILEANISSLILKPAGYAVALEKITNIIVDENKGLKPIPNKQLSKEFRTQLNEVLESFKNRIEDVGNTDSITILQKNIDKINNPTNRDKLTKPFDIYGIKLEEDDLNAIDNRNNFLHGISIKINEGSDEFKDIWHISMRLNRLINKLILKHIGFSGYQINHVKHNEHSLGLEIKESLFEKI